MNQQSPVRVPMPTAKKTPAKALASRLPSFVQADIGCGGVLLEEPRSLLLALETPLRALPLALTGIVHLLHGGTAAPRPGSQPGVGGGADPALPSPPVPMQAHAEQGLAPSAPHRQLLLSPLVNASLFCAGQTVHLALAVNHPARSQPGSSCGAAQEAAPVLEDASSGI